MNLNANKLLIVAALSAPLVGCGELLFAELEQPEVCKAMPALTFSGTEFQKTMTINLAEQLPGLDVTSPDGLKGVFNITRVELSAVSGITNFDFIDSAKITLLPPEASPLEPVDVIDYTREGSTTETLNLAGSSQVDLYEYLTGGEVTVNAALTGTLPDTDWSMGIKTCLYAKVRANYIELGESLANPPKGEDQAGE